MPNIEVWRVQRCSDLVLTGCSSLPSQLLVQLCGISLGDESPPVDGASLLPHCPTGEMNVAHYQNILKHFCPQTASCFRVKNALKVY